MVTSRYDNITVDAHASAEQTFRAFVAVPDRSPAPAVVLFQEVFGVNDNMRQLAVRLADNGFHAVVPDMFWRLRPGFERRDETGLAEGMELAARLDYELAVQDMTATLAHVRADPGCSPRAGAVGFCLGGTLAYLFATSARVDGRGPDAVVSYYGSAVHDHLALASDIECPMLFHFGDDDPYISRAQIAAVEAAVANRPDIAVHRYAAGHAFSNFDAPSFYDADAADLAWGRTLAFLDDTLT
ncbi:dienelactone hydrolase family protein [Saccharomonospora azurea]|uniref:dienelactone hydrolase family protein n=1 Tax=Saccharomonospora azurea TaxID=40988 RepID=UPI002409448B|nr:dienelactone hydrolase family protein [Saccharomonospora azurea]